MARARMLQRQQGHRQVEAALLVAVCIALSAMAPGLGTPLAAAAAAAEDDDVFFDTFRDLCLNSSVENRNKTCGSVIPAACAALDAKINADLSDVTSSRVDLPAIARDVLSSGLDDPASRARATACAAALSDAIGNKAPCRSVSLSKNAVVSAKKRKKLVDQAPARLVRMCGKTKDEIPACEYRERDAEKCLDLFRQGKSTFEKIFSRKEEVNVNVLLDPKTYTETVTVSEPVTVDCCNLTDRCLCQLKKKLGNDTTNFGIRCLEKKELQVCK